MYRIVYKRRALRALHRLPRDLARRILEKLESLAPAPFAPEHDVVPLQGRSGYRLRVGGWRILFSIDEKEILILVVDIRP